MFPLPPTSQMCCVCVCVRTCARIHMCMLMFVCIYIYLCAFKVGLALLASSIGIAHSHCYATSCGFPLEGSQGVCILYSSFFQCPQLCASLRGSTLEIIVSLLLFLAWVSQRKWTSQTSRWWGLAAWWRQCPLVLHWGKPWTTRTGRSVFRWRSAPASSTTSTRTRSVCFVLSALLSPALWK